MERRDQINEINDVDLSEKPYDDHDDEKIPREHQTRAGELILANRKYENREEEGIDLAQINIREATETKLIFRRIPFAIWFAGFVIELGGLYLIYHLALGHFGVLFKGYREGHWW
jgi:hypothetical protein